MGHDARILLLDIEVAPNIMTSWGLKVPSGYLGHENIVEERTILCAAWKWVGADRVYSTDVLTDAAKKGDAPDKAVCAKLHAALSSAHCVIAHNGDSFDIPWIKARLVALGFPPPPPVKSIDTKKLAKQHFYFNSNRLDYLGRYLGLGRKIKTDFELWMRCIRPTSERDRRKAIMEMVRYNRQDVRLLEAVWDKLRPFVPSPFNVALFAEAEYACRACGSEKVQQRGYSVTKTARHLRYHCQDCGAWSSRPAGSKVLR